MIDIRTEAKTSLIPHVSIVVVSYNHESFIDETLESCIIQLKTFSSLEIIVADDGSKDKTQEIIKKWQLKYPDLIIPILSEVNTGIASNFNRGLSVARGKFIAWLGGDDLILENKIKCQFDFISMHPNASGCYHDAEVFSWPSNETLGKFSDLYAGKAAGAKYVNAKKMLDPRYQMLPSTLMIRKFEIPANFDERLCFHNDYLYDFENIVNNGPYVRMSGVFARYRKHEKSIGVDQKTRNAMLEENLVTLAIIESRYPSYSRLVKKRAVYYLTLECIRQLSISNTKTSLYLIYSIFNRGYLIRAFLLLFFGRFLIFLSTPKFRKLAIKFRSYFG